MQDNNNTPLVSVCMPMYNAAKYLRECIDSVLAQSFVDFEFIIVDDGSTDDSVEIVKSYDDPRIRLIQNGHDYIGSLNLSINMARGRYIARIDSDDSMVSDRLQIQYDFMESTPFVDLLATGMNFMGDKELLYEPSVTHRCLTPQDMIAGCCISHPTVFVRTSVLREHYLQYKEKYKYAEDYKLWVEMLMKGLHLMNIPTPLTNYRVSCGQISQVKGDIQARVSVQIQEELSHWVDVVQEATKQENVDIPVSGNKLTLVIPFLNEGEEVANTVRSAREFVGNKVDVIVVNDCSTDGYDYERDLVGLNVHYIHNRISIGAAASKEKGARLATTPYFILLDAHMRFYDDTWLSRYIEELEKDDNRILCCQTKWLSKTDGIVKEGNKADTRGAFLRFCDTVMMPGIHWDNYKHRGHLCGDDIPAVLGATYGSSKRFWHKIKGLQGLIHYGCEEAYISIKAYMFGGRCTFLPDVAIGHIYRDSAPYQMYYVDTVYNNIWIMQTLFPTSLRCLAESKCYQLYPEVTKGVMDRIGGKKELLQDFRRYYLDMQRRGFDYILDINDQFIPEDLDDIQEKAALLPRIIRFVMSDNTDGIGIYCGLVGKIIFLCNAFIVSHEDALDDCASNMFAVLEKSVDQCYCWNFKEGLPGIGWGLIYLYSHGHIDDIEDLLYIIDKRLMCVNMRRISDFSFDCGLGGILAYVVARIGMCLRSNKEVPFDDLFIRELANQSILLIEKEKKVEDYRSHSYAKQLIEYVDGAKDWHILKPELWEIYEFPNDINENAEQWSISMGNSLGYGLFILSKLQKLFNILGKRHEIKFL